MKKSSYQARHSVHSDGSVYALIVRVDSDGQESVIHGYKGRYFATLKAAEKSTGAYIEKMPGSAPGRGKNPLPRSRAKRPGYIGKKSQITGRAPSPRLKKRRAKNTEKGYFPNPADKKFDGFVATYTVSAELNRNYWVVLGKFSDKKIAMEFAKLCAKKYPDCSIEVTDNK